MLVGCPVFIHCSVPFVQAPAVQLFGPHTCFVCVCVLCVCVVEQVVLFRVSAVSVHWQCGRHSPAVQV